MDNRTSGAPPGGSMSGMAHPGRVPDDVVTLVRSQSGVVRREQILQLGVSARTLSRRVAEGLWQPRGRRVLVFAGTAPGLLTESLVVAHSLFPDGVLTGFSALAVQGSLGADPWSAVPADPTPWVLYPRFTRVPARVVRERPGRARRCAGVPVAAQERALLDLARFLPLDEARTLVMRVAQRRGCAHVAAVLLGAVGLAPGYSGARQVGQLIEDLSTGAHSDAENRLVRLLAEAGVTGFVVNHPVRTGGRLLRIDVAFPAAKLAIEVDGRAYHTRDDRFQTDRTRQNLLVAAGWRVLRFTWEDLTQRPEQVLARIAALLAA